MTLILILIEVKKPGLSAFLPTENVGGPFMEQFTGEKLIVSQVYGYVCIVVFTIGNIICNLKIIHSL